MVVASDSAAAATLRRGYAIRVGGEQPVEVARVAGAHIILTRGFPRTLPFGTRAAYAAADYKLWDARKNQACHCDPGFAGYRCDLRRCPRGDDPLTHMSTADSAAGKVQSGTTSYVQRNERQALYVGTMRGSVGGTFRLTYTDPHGGRWPTEPIDVNDRLASRAFVDAADLTTVRFEPPLPHDALEAGDFLMLGDERKEVISVAPSGVDAAPRPLHLGGILTSATCRSAFAAAHDRAWAFRAGPRKGVAEALQNLPGGVLPRVGVEALEDGELVGYVAEGTAAGGGRGAGTSIRGIRGDFWSSAGQARPAPPARHGGLAPYDTVRIVTGPGGVSQYTQLRDVAVAAQATGIDSARGTGTLGGAALQPPTLGIGAGKVGAIFRAGGHALRVDFEETAGDLPELDCDGGDLFSGFRREYVASVTASRPQWVATSAFDGQPFRATAAYPFDGAMGANQHLRLAAGMTVRLGGQTRTVVAAHADVNGGVGGGGGGAGGSGFSVDLPFEESAASEWVDGRDYLFYRYPVEQLYTERTYEALKVAVIGLRLKCSANTVVVNGASAVDAGIITAASSVPFTSYFYPGDVVTFSGGTAGQLGEQNNQECLVAAVTGNTITCSLNAATRLVANQACTTDEVTIQLYLPLGSFSVAAAPPLRRGGELNWCYATDMRPLRWAAPDVSASSTTTVRLQVPELDRASAPELRAVAHAEARTVTIDASSNTLTVATSGAHFTVATAPSAANGVAGGFAAVFEPGVTVTVSGLASSGNNVNCVVAAVGAMTLTCVAGAAAAAVPATAEAVTVGTVTFRWDHGTLLGGNRGVAVGDRVRVKGASGGNVYETRSVEKVHGSSAAGEVTLLTVADAFSTGLAGASGGEARYAWLDWSGTTESLECGRRGVCDSGDGVCACFAGFVLSDCSGMTIEGLRDE